MRSKRALHNLLYPAEPRIPLVFRWGLFHSLRRTVLYYVIHLSLVVFVLSSVDKMGEMIGDPLTYLSPVFVYGLYKATRIASDNLAKFVGAYDDVIDFYDVSQFPSKQKEALLFSLFKTDSDYARYRRDAIQFLYSRTEVAIFFVVLVVWFAIWFPGSFQTGIFGSFHPIMFPVSLCLVFAANSFLLLFSSSSACVILSLTRIVYNLRRYQDTLKTTDYVTRLDSQLKKTEPEGTPVNNNTMDYHSSYLILSQIGDVQSSISLILFIIVSIVDIYWILWYEMWGLGSLWGLSSQMVVVVITAASFLLAMTFFVWGQLDLHGLLKEMKTKVLLDITMKRNEILTSLPPQKVTDKRLDTFHKTFDVWNSIMKSTENIPTWSLPPSSTLQVSLAVLVPIILVVLTYILDNANSVP